MSQLVSGSSIRVGRPASGTIKTITSAAGAKLHLEFPEDDALFARSGNDLLIGVNGGGSVVVSEFFATGELPVMRLYDGSEVAAKDFLSAQASDMDLSTASGPKSSGSGTFYEDGAASLIAGVETIQLKSETAQWFEARAGFAASDSLVVGTAYDAEIVAPGKDPNVPDCVIPPMPTVPVVSTYDEMSISASTDTIVATGINYVKGNVLDGVYTPEGGDEVETGLKVNFGADGPAGGVPSVEWAKVGTFLPEDGGPAVALTLNVRGHLIGTDGKDYGVLVLKADGSYTYTKVAGSAFEGQIKVNFTIEDGDGDRATAPIVLRVTDNDVDLGAPKDDGDWDARDPGKGGEGYDLVAYESKLDKAQDGAPHDGSQADGKETWTMSKTFGFTSADGLVSLTIESVSGETLVLKPGGTTSGSIAGEYGTLRVEMTDYNPETGVGRISYSYHLSSNAEHNPGKGANTDLAGLDERFDMTLADRDGDTGTATINILIVDDMPSVSLDGGDSVAAGSTLTGAWTYAYNADGPGSLKVVFDGKQYNIGDAIDTGKGTLTVKADGTWTFEGAKGLDTSVAQKISFSLRITDSDGDTVVVGHDVEITKAAGPTWDDPSGGGMGDVLTLHEMHSRNGAVETHEVQVGFTAGSADITGFALGIADGADAPKVVAGGVEMDITWAKVGDAIIGSQNGVEVIKLEVVGFGIIGAHGSGSVSVKATLLHQVQHGSSPNTDSVSIDGLRLTVTDRDGNSVEAKLAVTVEDDKPAVSVFGPSTVAEGTTLSDVWTHDYNADGEGSLVVIFGGKEYAVGDAIDTGKGILTVKADGTWTFEAATNLDSSVLQAVNFTVKITDKDGDSVSSNHYMQITKGDGPTWVDPGTGEFGNNIAVHEAHARNGAEDAHSMKIAFTAGSDDITGFSLDLGTGGNAPKVIAGGVEMELTWAKVGDALIGSQDGVAVIKLELVNPGAIAAQTSGEVEVKATLLHPIQHGMSPNTDTVSINGLELTVTDRDGDTATAKLSVTIDDDKPEISVSGASTVTLGETLSGTWTHAYNADGEGSLKVIFDGKEYGVGDAIDTGKGILTVKADGTWTFQSLKTASAGDKIDFELKITDKDGDTATAGHDVRFAKSDGPTWDDPSGGGNGNDIVLHEVHTRGGNAETHLIDVGFTAGGADITAFSLDLAGGADAPKVIAGGVELPITWTKVGDALIGSQNGVDVIKLELVNPGVIGAQSTGSVTVKATLLHAVQHDSNPNADTVTIDGLRLTVTDRDGESVSAKMVVTVEDDKPTVSVNGASSVTVGGTLSGTWTHDYNADGPGSLKVIVAGKEYSVGDTIDTGKGLLTVNADGTWNFKAAAGLDTSVLQSINFSVKITDSDGDSVSRNHYVEIKAGGPTWVDPGTGEFGNNVAVHEWHARNGAEDAHSMKVGFTAGSDDITGFALNIGVGADAPKVIAGGVELELTWAKVGDALIGSQNGVAVIKLELVNTGSIAAGTTGEVEVKATLLQPIQHEMNPNEDSVSINGLQLTVTDGNGASATAGLSVTIDDDKPVVDVHGGTSVLAGATLTGDWTHDYNADGAGSLKVVFNGIEYDLGNPIDTGKGLLTVNTDGTWNFKAATNIDTSVPQNVSFSVVITDKDGDTATSTHGVSITKGDVPIWVDPGTGEKGNNVAVHEWHARNGAEDTHTMKVGFTAGSDDITKFELSLGTGADAPKVFSGGAELPITWSKVGNDLIGYQNGEAVIKLELVSPGTIAALESGDVTVKATLLTPIQHGMNPNTDEVTITGLRLTATDIDGDTATAKLSVTIDDDKPVVSVNGATSLGYGETVSGAWTHDYNADGAGSLKVLVNGTEYNIGDAIDTGKGILTVKADGTWTFAADPSLTSSVHNVSFTVQITDSDGDTATSKHALQISKGDGPRWIDDGCGDTVTLHDAHTRGGNADSHTIKVGFEAGEADITGFSLELGTTKVTAGGVELPLTWAKVGNDLIGYQNGVEMIRLELTGTGTIAAGTSDQIEVKATLLHPLQHEMPPTNMDSVTIEGISLKVVDADGNSAGADIVVTVVDDMPEVSVFGAASVAVGALTSGGWEHDYNADGPGSLKVVFDGKEYDIDEAIDTGNGTLTVRSDGTWTFRAKTNLDMSKTQEARFTVKITDSDGDTATNDHTVVITPGKGPSWVDPGTGDLGNNVALHDLHTRNGAEDTHNMWVEFSAGSGDIADFDLHLGTGADAPKVYAGGVELPITWTKVGNTLIGSQDGVDVIRLELVGTGTIAAQTAGEVEVKATLLHPIQHEMNPNEDSVTITGLQLTATDGNGASATAKLSVTVEDDKPVVEVTGGAGVRGGETLEGDWTHDYHADGAGNLVVIFDGKEYKIGDNIDTGKGILTVNDDGTWTFAAKDGLDPLAEHKVEFSVKITDSDGDSATSTHSVKVTQGPIWVKPPNADYDSVTLHDEHLRAPGAVETHDVDVSFTAGSEAITGFELGLNGPEVFAGGVKVDLVWTKVGNTLVGSQGGVDMIKLELTGPSNIAAGETGDVTVKATLLHPIQHAESPTNFDSVSIKGLELTVTDAAGAKATAQLSVTVEDDKPVVEVTGEAGVKGGDTLEGDWTHDYRADGEGSLVVIFDGTEYKVGDAIDTGKGILTVKTDGTWTFEAKTGLDPLAEHKVEFSVKITDSDGDSATSTHSVKVTQGPIWVKPPNGDYDNVTLHDEHLRAPGAVETHDVDVSFTAGSEAITGFELGLNGPEVFAGGVKVDLVWTKVGNTLVGSQGGVDMIKLELTGPSNIAAGETGDVTVKATLLHPIQHAESPTNFDSVSIKGLELTVTDAAGAKATAQLSVTVEDDKPVVEVTGDAGVKGGETLEGDWTHDYRADGEGSLVVIFDGTEYKVGDAIDTGKGILTVKTDGTWTFAAKTGLDPLTEHKVEFSVKITDSDGDSATSTHSVKVTQGPIWVKPPNADYDSVTLHDEHLRDPAAVESHEAAVSFTAGSEAITGFELGLNGPEVFAGGVKVDLVWTKVGNTLIGSQGGVDMIKLELTGSANIAAGETGDVTVKATLLHPIQHAESPTNFDSVSIKGLELTVTDAAGAKATAQLSVTVEDDKPVVEVTGDAGVKGGETLEGDWTHDYRADGEGSLVVIFDGTEYKVGDAIDTGKGILTVKTDGTWTFAAKDGLDPLAEHKVEFSVKITDSDGDSATSTHSLKVTQGPIWVKPPNADYDNVTLHDEHLRAPGAVETHDVDVSFTAGSEAITGFELGLNGPEVFAGGVKVDLVWTKVGNTLIGSQGGVDMIKLELTGPANIAAGETGDVTVKATLLHPIQHAESPTNFDSVSIKGLELTVTDASGATATAQLSVTVEDDKPVVEVIGSAGSVQEGTTVDGTWTHDYRADGEGSLVVLFNGTEYKIGEEIDTGYGILQVKTDGSWTFKAAEGDFHNEPTVSFGVKITDADGDSAVSNHSFKITEGTPPKWNDPDPNSGLGNNVVLHDEHLRSNATDEHSMQVSFTAGSDDIVKFALELGTGADAPKVFLGGVSIDVTWKVEGGKLVGYQDSLKVITLELDGPSSIAAGTSGVATIKATLEHAVSHGMNPNTDTVTITGLRLIATDSDGDQAAAKLSVTVADDKPLLEVVLDPTAELKPGEIESGQLQLTEGGDGADWSTFKIDGKAVSWNSTTNTGSVTVDGGKFDLVYNPATGKMSYSFTADPALKDDLHKTYTFTIADKDGDSTSASIGIDAKGSGHFDIEIKPLGNELAVHEDGLSWGTHKGDAAHPVTTQGVIEVASDGGLSSIEIDGQVINLPAGWDGSTYTPTGATWTTPTGTLTIDGIKETSAGHYEVLFTYKLTSNTTAHSDTSDSHEKLSTGDAAAQAAMPQFSFKVSDNYGHISDPAKIAVDIYDDGPVIGLTHAPEQGDGHVHLDNSYMTTGTLEVNYGADRAAGTTDDFLDVTFEGTRHIMVNGSPVATDFNETVHVFLDSSGKGTAYTGLGYIEFTKQANGTITYTYLAKHGLKGDSEKLTFTAKDGDGDTAAQSYTVEMDHDVPAGTSYVDEAGIPGLGSHHVGYYEPTMSFEVYLPEGTTSVTWDLDAIQKDVMNSFKADANGDGVYSNVTWSIDAATGKLVAMAEGKIVLTVTQQADPTPDGHGNYSSEFTVELHYPIQHLSGNGYNTHSLFLGFKATSPGENGGILVTSNAVAVAIVDDAPSVMEKNLHVVEAVPQGEDVYLLMDVSASINDADFNLGIKALQALVQKYIDLGIESKFSLVTFGSDALVRTEHVTAQEMLSYLKSSSINSLVAGHSERNTDYDSGLDAAQRLIEAGIQDGELRQYLQKVYFISDGAPNVSMDTNFASWKAFIQNHQGTAAGHDQVEVFAVGVGAALKNAANWEILMSVTADGPDHGIPVEGYNKLADQLTALVEPSVTSGNLFGVHMDNNDVTSADKTEVLSATFGGMTKNIIAGGTTFSYDGVTLKIYPDGRYEITSTKSVDHDVELPLSYTLRDADGDTSTTQNVKIILQDAKPEAFDNVAGHADSVYQHAIGNGPVVLDDFGARGGANEAWYASRYDTVTYNTSFNTSTYRDINGNPASSAGVNFVKIDARMPEYFETTPDYWNDMTFNQALRDITGKTAPELFGAGSPGSTGNASDKPYSGSYIEKGVDLYTAGSLKFNFVFDRGSTGSANSQEHAFAVLLDASGKVIWSGLIEPNPGSTSDVTAGVCSIPVAKAGHYTLIIGCYDVNGESLPSQYPTLYVDQVAFEPDTSHGKNVYHGNMIEDVSPMGEKDTMGDHAVLQTITINGHDYTMVAAGLVLHDVFATGDLLTVSATGEYSYQTPSNSFDNVNIEYTLKEPGSSDADSATLYIRSDEYRHEGTSGSEHIDLSGKTGNHVVMAGDGNDTITGSDGNDVIFTGNGNNLVHAGNGNDTIHGGSGDDTIYGGAGNDVIHGGAGDDVIYGGDGNDTIYGGDGNDIIYGGKGSDVMYGGEGYDVFAWAKADYEAGSIDKIMDFTLREDRLSFADIFGDTQQHNVALKDILTALENDRLSLQAFDQNNLTITVNDTVGALQQTVEVHLEGNGIDAALLAEIMSGDEAAKAALLQQMLTNLGG